jgi:hypothetical protein
MRNGLLTEALSGLDAGPDRLLLPGLKSGFRDFLVVRSRSGSAFGVERFVLARVLTTGIGIPDSAHLPEKPYGFAVRAGSFDADGY